MATDGGRSINLKLARAVIVIAIVGLCGQGVAQSAWRSVYSEQFGEDAHPLYAFGGVIGFGPQTDSPFLARMTGGVLELFNDVDSTTSRYYFVEPKHASQWLQAGGAPPLAGVTVGGEFGQLPGAGLIYRVDPATRWFYAFLLGAGSNYGFFLIDASGFTAIVQGTSDAVLAGRPNRLSIVPDGSVMHLYINDRHVTSVDDSRVMGVGVGIMAAGTGTYTFDDFELLLPQ